jgi:hypothetical protein
VEDSKKRRADLQKKMLEEGQNHNAERKKLQQSEMQAKQRQLQAETALQRLEVT